jgi:hypothetical protein
MTIATPMLAVIAISWMTCTGISRMVTKPTRSASSATIAGSSSWRNVRRAAPMLSRPSNTASFTALTFCTPWLTPMAKMRKGTSNPNGSMP